MNTEFRYHSGRKSSVSVLRSGVKFPVVFHFGSNAIRSKTMRSLTQPSQDLVQDYPDLRLPESLAKSHMLGESFRTIEHESAAPRSFSTMGLLASSYAFQCRRNVVDGVIKRPFKCVFLAPGRRIPSLMHAILLCESEVILNCGIDIHSAIGDSHY